MKSKGILWQVLFFLKVVKILWARSLKKYFYHDCGQLVLQRLVLLLLTSVLFSGFNQSLFIYLFILKISLISLFKSWNGNNNLGLDMKHRVLQLYSFHTNHFENKKKQKYINTLKRLIQIRKKCSLQLREKNSQNLKRKGQIFSLLSGWDINSV